MESRSARKTLRAFPVDFRFTQDPTDDLRLMVDAEGRPLDIASEYMQDQLDNIFPSIADPNEPAVAFVSGVTVGLDTELDGNFVQDPQDLASMEVTGFDFLEIIIPSGLPDGSTLTGISYVDDPTTSGQLYLGTDAGRTVYKYNWKETDTVIDSFEFGLVTQSFDNLQADEYLTINKDADPFTATLQHTPIGNITIIDTKNLKSPWDPTNSEGLIVPSGDYTISGDTITLTSPRPSYSPATRVGIGEVLYPTDYQPDLNWDSSFIVEYQYAETEQPYGLSQSLISHELGLPSDLLGAAEKIE